MCVEVLIRGDSLIRISFKVHVTRLSSLRLATPCGRVGRCSNPPVGLFGSLPGCPSASPFADGYLTVNDCDQSSETVQYLVMCCFGGSLEFVYVLLSMFMFRWVSFYGLFRTKLMVVLVRDFLTLSVVVLNKWMRISTSLDVKNNSITDPLFLRQVLILFPSIQFAPGRFDTCLRRRLD